MYYPTKGIYSSVELESGVEAIRTVCYIYSELKKPKLSNMIFCFGESATNKLAEIDNDGVFIRNMKFLFSYAPGTKMGVGLQDLYASHRKS